VGLFDLVALVAAEPRAANAWIAEIACSNLSTLSKFAINVLPFPL
jgi:hypothetical protein